MQQGAGRRRILHRLFSRFLVLYFNEISAHSDKILAHTDHTEKQVVNNLFTEAFNKYPNV